MNIINSILYSEKNNFHLNGDLVFAVLSMVMNILHCGYRLVYNTYTRTLWKVISLQTIRLCKYNFNARLRMKDQDLWTAFALWSFVCVCSLLLSDFTYVLLMQRQEKYCEKCVMLSMYSKTYNWNSVLHRRCCWALLPTYFLNVLHTHCNVTKHSLFYQMNLLESLHIELPLKMSNQAYMYLEVQCFSTLVCYSTNSNMCNVHTL